jgi:DNA-binding NarL/FixJ family response regulator
MTAALPTVVVVDDHDFYRRGLVALLRESGVSVVGEASSGPEAVEVTLRERPDVVLMDLNLPGFDGIEAVRRLAEAASAIPVMVLTLETDESIVVDALTAGAAGYLLKDAVIDEVLAGIRAAVSGESLLSPRVARGLVRRLQEEGAAPAPSVAALTERERRVLALMADGQGNAEIAATLFISQSTVKSHVSSVLGKLGVGNRVQAVVRAHRDGLLQDRDRATSRGY